MLQFLGMLAAIALTAFCWGVYGPVLHFGREAMHSNLRPFMCVGLAYFVIAVIVPLALLARGGERGGWTSKGVLWSLLAGTAGALGALGTILALACGGKPFTVMPVVFGCAPVINTLTTLALAHTPTTAISPWFLAGLLVVAAGAATVLAFGPRGHAPAPAK